MQPVCPKERMVDKIEAAMPKSSLLTADMTAWLYGEANRENPTPQIIRLPTTYQIELVCERKESIPRDTAQIPMPIAESLCADSLSDSRPESGEKSAITTVCAAKRKPACRAEQSRADCRYSDKR